MSATLDHLVVAADWLERGVAHVEACLGVVCEPGGQHPRMGTHNALLRLGADTYIEVIAIDPDGAPPDTPRWFGLDDPAIQARLSERPRLLTWVARTDDIVATIDSTVNDPGPVRRMQRGELEWQIAFRTDGALIEHGLVPSLIEWGTNASHPTTRLTDHGLRLERLIARHDHPSQLHSQLDALGLAGTLAVAATDTDTAKPGLEALIDTPQGKRWLL